MIDLRTEMMRMYRPLSLGYLRAKFVLPNMYYASSINDVSDNIGMINETLPSFFRPKEWHGSAAVMINHCSYGGYVESGFPTERLALMDLAATQLIYALDPGNLDARDRIEATYRLYHNTSISDVTGTLPVRCFEREPAGASFDRIWLKVNPESKLIDVSLMIRSKPATQNRGAMNTASLDLGRLFPVFVPS